MEEGKGGQVMDRTARVIVTVAVLAVSMEVLLVAGRILMPDVGLPLLAAAVLAVMAGLGLLLWRMLPRDDG